MEETNRLPVMFDEKENSTQSPERPALIKLVFHLANLKISPPRIKLLRTAKG